MKQHTSRRFWVHGRVQGVGFRAATAREAKRLGLAGYACNLDDGRVEVLAVGPTDAIAQLAVWLKRGPRMAAVEELIEQEASDHESELIENFTIY